MKLFRFISSLLLSAAAAWAEPTFPGLQKILTTAEWQRAGLDRLTPDQLGVIDAALIRYLAFEPTRTAEATSRATPPPPPPGASPAEAAATRSRFWERFGLAKLTDNDWRTQPPMSAKVTSWLGANRFALDTGQVWEGIEAIPYEILGHTVTIEARPMGNFALKLNEERVAVRVRRLR